MIPNLRTLPRRHLTFGIEGVVKSVELVDVKTGIVERRIDTFKNIITDAGLDAIGNGTQIGSLVNYLAVGTGSTTPAVSQTTLDTQLGARYNANGGFADVVSSEASYAYWELERTRVIPTTDGNGNLTELALFSAATSGTMWMRQLFRDEVGDPTTIVKQSTQQLRVTYAWRIYPTLTAGTSNIVIDGVATTCSERAMQVDDANEWGSGGLLTRLGEWSALTANCRAYETDTIPTTTGGALTGTYAAASSASYAAYVNGDFYRDILMVWEPSVANHATGIGSIGFTIKGNGVQCLSTQFTPKVAKTDTKRFSYTARISWGRV